MLKWAGGPRIDVGCGLPPMRLVRRVVPPLDDLPGWCAALPSSAAGPCCGPGRGSDAVRRVALTRRAVPPARQHLALREDRVEAVPRLDLGPVDGLEVARRPDLEVLVVVAAEMSKLVGAVIDFCTCAFVLIGCTLNLKPRSFSACCSAPCGHSTPRVITRSVPVYWLFAPGPRTRGRRHRAEAGQRGGAEAALDHEVATADPATTWSSPARCSDPTCRACRARPCSRVARRIRGHRTRASSSSLMCRLLSPARTLRVGCATVGGCKARINPVQLDGACIQPS